MISLVTLFGGRPRLLEAYFTALDNLDWPKDDIQLVWVTNSDDKVFLRTLNMEFAARAGDYADSTFLALGDIPPSQCAHRENYSPDEIEHAKIIAKMYNAALTVCKGELLFALEDDVFCPRFALASLVPHMADETLAVATGITFNRHKPNELWGWDLRKVNRITNVPGQGGGSVMPPPSIVEDYVGVPMRKPWGVTPIGLTTLGATLIRSSMIRAVGGFKPTHPMSLTLRGCDMVMNLDFELRGWKRLADFNVVALHFSSDGVPH